MKIIDSKTPSFARPSAYLHGLTGMGKSTWAATGGRPLVILTEPKAASVLRKINPEAVGMAPESLDDLVRIFEILGQQDRLQAKGFDRIILDSVTELTNSIPRWMRDHAGNREILTKLELSEYGQVRDYAMATVKAIQLTGLPSVIIARSTSKRVGMVERIVPDGTGSAVDHLPGKLLPTAEARFDADLGWVIDTTPAEHSQRCGLPWLPAIWRGSCLDFLSTVEGEPSIVAPKDPVPPPPPPVPEAAGPSAAFVEAVEDLNQAAVAAGVADADRILMVQDAMEAGETEANLAAIAEMIRRLHLRNPVEEGAKPAEAEKADFVDHVAAGPGISDHEWRDLLDLCLEHKVDQDALYLYCADRGHLLPGREDRKLGQLLHKPWADLVRIISDPQKRRSIVAAIQPFAKPTTPKP